ALMIHDTTSSTTRPSVSGPPCAARSSRAPFPLPLRPSRGRRAPRGGRRASHFPSSIVKHDGGEPATARASKEPAVHLGHDAIRGNAWEGGAGCGGSAGRPVDVAYET